MPAGRPLHKLFMAGLMLAGLFLPALSHANDYTIKQLEKKFSPISISDSGLIVGKDKDGAIKTLRIDHSDEGKTIAIIPRDTLDVGNEATQINDSNFVTGYANNTARLWENGNLSAELNSFTNLIKAAGINGFNEIVGIRYDSTSTYRRPFHYDIFSGRLTTLGTLGGAEGWANGLNNSGYVVGGANDKEGNNRAFRYNSQVATLAPINPIDGYRHSEGWKINDDESVIGWHYNDTKDQIGKRAFYSTLSGLMANLGTIAKDTGSVARGLNNHGEIVGQSIRADGRGLAFRFNTTSADEVIVAVDPDNAATVYAHSTKGQGILKSIDKGENWRTINQGLAGNGLFVNAMLIDEANSSTLYAGTNGGLYKSVNGGNSWSLFPNTLEKVRINALYMNPVSKRLFAGTNGGIYYSDDMGENWILSNSSTAFNTYNFVSHINRPDTVFAATSRGVYSSTDNGQFWSRQNGQAPTALLSLTVSALTIDPNDPKYLYAATVGGGVFRSDITAGSLQWTAINDNSLFNLNVYALIFYDNNGISTLFAGSTSGIYQREIGSPAWTQTSSFGNRGAYAMALGKDSSNTLLLYASTSDGDVFRSEQGPGGTPLLASNWDSITRGISLADIYAIATIPKSGSDPLSQTHILAGANNGFFKLSYKNPGDTTSWKSSRSGGSGMKILALSHDSRTSPYTLWAGTSDQGVLISHDNGDTWNPSNEGLDNWNVYALAADTTPATATLFAGTLGGVYRSEDGGIHWTKASSGLNNNPVFSLLLDTRVTPALLYAGTANGVYRSSDYGRFWVAMNTGMTGKEIVALQLTNSGHILAGSISGGFYYSDDDGQSWTPNNNGSNILSIFDIAEDPFQPGRVFAATSKGIQRLACDPLPCIWQQSYLDQHTVISIRLDPDNANHIFAGTLTNGMQVSTNLGSSWQDSDTSNAGITTVTNRMESLNDLLSLAVSDNKWDLQDATDINNNGEIIGWGYQDTNGDGTFDPVNEKYGYLLIPSIGTAEVDLEVTQTTQPETIKKGIPFNYHIAITNHGPGTETSAKLIDWLPPDIVFRVVATSQGYCEKRPENIIRCELGGIPAGKTVYVNIFMESPYRDVQIHNIARVKGNERDTNPGNNTTSAGNTVTIDKCFIATAAYGSFLDPHVTALRNFRDQHLLTNAAGRAFVTFYYRHSPPIANFIADSTLLRAITRAVLAPIVYAVIYPLAAMAVAMALTAVIIWQRQRRRRALLNAS